MAFSERILGIAKDNLKTLAKRAIAHHYTPELTRDDIYQMLVLPDHIEDLTKVDRMCGTIQTWPTVGVSVPVPNAGSPTMTVKFKDPLTRLLPKYVHGGFHGRYCSVREAAVNAWVNRRYDVGCSFALAERVLVSLDKHLANPSQMALYFGGVAALLGMSSNPAAMKVATRVREARVPANLPSIDPVLRDCAQDATKLIARALLFPKEERPESAVTFSFGEKLLGHVPLPWNDRSLVEVI